PSAAYDFAIRTATVADLRNTHDAVDVEECIGRCRPDTDISGARVNAHALDRRAVVKVSGFFECDISVARSSGLHVQPVGAPVIVGRNIGIAPTAAGPLQSKARISAREVMEGLNCRIVAVD